MNYDQIKNLCRKGYVGIIPGWIGYLYWDYAIDNIYFKNEDYRLEGDELFNKIKNRTDIYYII